MPRTQQNLQRNHAKSAGGVLSLAADGFPTLMIPVTSADEASALLQRYRNHYGIGASNMSEGCGNVLATDGTLLAKVSYIGRVWNSHGELLQEAVLDSRDRA